MSDPARLITQKQLFILLDAVSLGTVEATLNRPHLTADDLAVAAYKVAETEFAKLPEPDRSAPGAAQEMK